MEHPLIRPVILCGGSGTRLWPASRAFFPKQLVPFFPDGSSLLQATLERVCGQGFAAPLLVAHEEHRFQAQHQALERSCEPRVIILEQEARNTAAAIALAAEWLRRQAAGELMLVLPSDHVIDDAETFARTVRVAAPAAQQGRLVTIGLTPTRPDTGFGYIEADPASAAGSAIMNVASFIEKPDAETARQLCATGRHLWNAGIFLFDPTTFMDELARHAPAIAEWARSAVPAGDSDGLFFRPGGEREPAFEPISIDYAVMERTDKASVVPATFGWSDVGSWDAVWRLLPQDEQGNARLGEVFALDCQRSLLRADDGLVVTALGVEDMIVVATRDAVLVTPRAASQHIGRLVGELRASGAAIHQLQRKVNRPWGSYELTDQGERFQTKRIIVRPGACLSLQLHRQRSEHWVVVSGTAEVTLGERTFLLEENQSTYIPAGTRHRLCNPGDQPLHLIEVQCGPYLGEDDIVRFDDAYGRADPSDAA